VGKKEGKRKEGKKKGRKGGGKLSLERGTFYGASLPRKVHLNREGEGKKEGGNSGEDVKEI